MRYLEAAVLVLALAPQVSTGQVVDKCQAAKIKAAGKKTYDKAKCRQKALTKGVAIDPLCLTKAEDKFAQAITKADTLGSCSGTATELEAAVDQCVAAYVALLTQATTTTTVADTTTTTTTTMPGCAANGSACGTNADCCSNSCVFAGGAGSCQNTTTTTTSIAPTTTLVCCQGLVPICEFVPSASFCDNSAPTFFTPGPAGSVCNGSGGCSASASPSHCCELATGCAVGPYVDTANCSAAQGTYFDIAICMPDGTCQ